MEKGKICLNPNDIILDKSPCIFKEYLLVPAQACPRYWKRSFIYNNIRESNSNAIDTTHDPFRDFHKYPQALRMILNYPISEFIFSAPLISYFYGTSQGKVLGQLCSNMNYCGTQKHSTWLFQNRVGLDNPRKCTVQIFVRWYYY